MLYLVIGVVAVFGAAALVRAFLAADPKALARGVRLFLITIGVGVAALLLVVLLASDRFGGGLAELAGAGMVLWRVWRRQQHGRGASTSPGGQVSEVESDYLRMRLDHETGTMSGTVRRGRHQGRALSELGRDELVALWRECRAEDEPGAKLLETYLDRLVPGWREAASAGGGAGRASDAMTVEEAYAILDLAPGAGAAEIREAHRRLMLKLHPDHGGSTYLAVKLNRAREILLRS